MARLLFPPPANIELENLRDQHVFGIDARVHRVTGLPIEQGSGALSVDEQVQRVHLPYIHFTYGPEAAAAMRLRLQRAANKPTP